MKRERPRRPLPRLRKDSEPRERYHIGYGKPPRQTQFRKGQSGNPKGRPKGSKNAATILRELMDRKIPVRAGGGPARPIKVIEAILTRVTEAALRGDTKAAAFLFQRYDTAQPGNAQEPAATPDEQEIIDSYLDAYLQRREGRR